MLGLFGAALDTGEQFIKGFKVAMSKKVSVFFIREDGSCMPGLPGKLAEGERILLMPTLQRLFVHPKIYRDPLGGGSYAVIYEKNIRCIDVTEFGRQQDAINLSVEAYNVYVAKILGFLKPGSTILVLLFFILGWALGMIIGAFSFWALF